MGRTGWKTTAESARRIELPRLKQMGYLPKGGGIVSGNLSWSRGSEPSGNIYIFVDTQSENPSIRFSYRSRDWWEKSEDAWVDRDYPFPLEKTPCRYGGYKWYIRCQLTKNGRFCGKRVRVLYSVGGYYGCRDCADITYEKCNYGGRYKGFLSIPDLDRQEEKVKRRFYAGKPTRQYRKLLKMEEQFERSFVNMSLLLTAKRRK